MKKAYKEWVHYYSCGCIYYEMDEAFKNPEYPDYKISCPGDYLYTIEILIVNGKPYERRVKL